MSDLLLIITVRSGSERLPGKVAAEVAGKPLLTWIIKRVQTGVPSGTVVVATTQNKEDDLIEVIAGKNDVACYRHPDPDDVVGRMNAVVAQHRGTCFVMRVLGDCPFLETKLINRATHVLRRTGDELFLWRNPPNQWPVYGAREFPISISAWNKIQNGARGAEREHPDLWLNHNRQQFSITYHATPDTIYFQHPHRMRLEVDWPEDLSLVRAVATQGPGMLAPLRDIITWLNKNELVLAQNRGRVERTGPTVSYDKKVMDEWSALMRGKPTYTWKNELIQDNSLNPRGKPVYCAVCSREIGKGEQGVLYYQDAAIVEGTVTCAGCGEPRVWDKAVK